ncbi:hypothetical protein MRX96_009261 [Rhipicephalus microplus]
MKTNRGGGVAFQTSLEISAVLSPCSVARARGLGSRALASRGGGSISPLHGLHTNVCWGPGFEPSPALRLVAVSYLLILAPFHLLSPSADGPLLLYRLADVTLEAGGAKRFRSSSACLTIVDVAPAAYPPLKIQTLVALDFFLRAGAASSSHYYAWCALRVSVFFVLPGENVARPSSYSAAVDTDDNSARTVGPSLRADF